MMAMAAVTGAGYNVRINLTGINDGPFVEKMKKEAATITAEAEALAAEIRQLVEDKL